VKTVKGLEIWAVEWEDAHWNSGEFDRDEIIHKSISYVTVGIMIKNDETGLTVSSDISETGSFRGTNFIPRKMIVKTWKVGALQAKEPRVRRQSPSSSMQTKTEQKRATPPLSDG
jgi:hypothetical protein